MWKPFCLELRLSGSLARELGRKEDHGAGRERHFSLGSWGGGAGRALSLHGGREKCSHPQANRAGEEDYLSRK